MLTPQSCRKQGLRGRISLVGPLLIPFLGLGSTSSRWVRARKSSGVDMRWPESEAELWWQCCVTLGELLALSEPWLWPLRATGGRSHKGLSARFFYSVSGSADSEAATGKATGWSHYTLKPLFTAVQKAIKEDKLKNSSWVLRCTCSSRVFQYAPPHSSAQRPQTHFRIHWRNYSLYKQISPVRWDL